MATAQRQPLARQLLVPLILLGLALAALTFFIGWRQMSHQLDAQLAERAHTVARAIRFAAESTDSRDALTRLTQMMVAGGDVELIAVTSGQPPRVMIASRGPMQSVPVARLVSGGIDPGAVTVLSGDAHEEYRAHHRDVGLFVYAARLNPDLPTSHPLANSGVLIELPTLALQKKITASTLTALGAVLLLGGLGAAGFAWLLRRRVLTPLAASLDRERESGRLKVNFLGMISHEFRNTLGLVLSSTQILARYGERLEATERARHLEKIEASCRRLSGVVEDTLFYSRSESGRVTLNLEPLDLRAFCPAELSAAEPTTTGTSRIQLVIEPQVPATLVTDESLLRHILANLLANALKYSTPPTPVIFSVDAPDVHTLTLAVQDQGIGIPADEQSRIGEPFWRGRNVGGVSGTGLGLAIAQRCVGLLGGTLRCETPADGGTRFIVTLPRQPTRS